MQIIQNNQDIFTTLIIIVAASFFGSFARELNDMTKNSESFLKFLSEVLLNGVSGAILGIVANHYWTQDLLLLVAISATCGIMGVVFLKFVLKVAIQMFGKVKEIDIGKIDGIEKDIDDKD